MLTRRTFLLPLACFVVSIATCCHGADSLADRINGQPQEAIPLPPQNANHSAEFSARSRQVEIAKIELRLYDRVEYPTTVRRIETQIKLARAVHESAQRLYAKYDKTYRHRDSNPFLITLENARLAVTETKLRWDELKQEKCLAQQFHPDRLRLFQLRVEQAEAALQAVSAGK